MGLICERNPMCVLVEQCMRPAECKRAGALRYVTPSPGMTPKEMAALAAELTKCFEEVASTWGDADPTNLGNAMSYLHGIAAGLRIRAEAAMEGE